MKAKTVKIVLMDGCKPEFENVELNNSIYGISLNTDEKHYFFYPFHNVLCDAGSIEDDLNESSDDMNNITKGIICLGILLFGLIPNQTLIMNHTQKIGLFISFACFILIGFYAGKEWEKSK